MDKSRAQILAEMPKDKQKIMLQSMTEQDLKNLQYDWSFWGRPKQQPPEGSWLTWLILAGRGFGKTRTGAEWVKQQIERGDVGRIAAIAPTSSDVRDVMVEGESGILAVMPPDLRPEWWPSKNRLEFPDGQIVLCYPATEPDRLRGPQFHKAWLDELAAWDHLDDPYNAYTQVQLALRLGNNPQKVITTTPKPVPLLRKIASDNKTVLTKGSTYENSSNLAADFIESIEDQFSNTRVGRQEIYAEILDDAPGALWTRNGLERQRWKDEFGRPPEMVRVVMGVDPSVTSSEDSDETGIIIVGKSVDGQGFVLADASIKGTADEWGRACIEAFDAFNVDRVVGEVNNGGDLIERVLRTLRPNIPFKAVRASRGKAKRAEPVAALYEQGRVWHLGMFPLLEDQMSRFTPDGEFDSSPDRADALVWSLTELMLLKREARPFKKITL